MTDIFFGEEAEIKSKPKQDKQQASKREQLSATESLALSNICRDISFNNGKEGYIKVRPKALLASSHNPRPDWLIDDNWLKRHLKVDFNDIFEHEIESDCLVKLSEKEVNGDIIEEVTYPAFEDLLNSPDPSSKNQYEFLIELSKDIRSVGQVQPIEVETSDDNKSLVVLEGHLRRLACILGRIPYIKAIRNEGLHDLSKEQKVSRQISENHIRKDLSGWGLYLLAKAELDNNALLARDELAKALKISNNYAGLLKRIHKVKDKCTPLIFEALKREMIGLRKAGEILSFKQVSAQERELKKYLKGNFSLISQEDPEKEQANPQKGSGRARSASSFTLKTKENCIKAGNKLLELVPNLTTEAAIDRVESVEDMDKVFKSLMNILLRD